MARKKGGGGRGRQRAQQRAQYDELDKYPVMPPHAFARIVRDKRTLNIIYQIIEPPMTKKEQEQREEIMDIFIHRILSSITMMLPVNLLFKHTGGCTSISSNWE